MTGFLSSPIVISLVIACLVGIALFFYFRQRNEQIENRINSVYEFVKNEALIRNKQQELQLQMMRTQIEEQPEIVVNDNTLISVSDNEDQPVRRSLGEVARKVSEEYAESEEEEDTSDEEEEEVEIKRVHATMDEELPITEVAVRKVPDKVQTLKDELADEQVFRQAPVSEFGTEEPYTGAGVATTFDDEVRELVGLDHRENGDNGENAGESIQYIGTAVGDDGQPVNVVIKRTVDGDGSILAPTDGDTTETNGDNTGNVPATSSGDGGEHLSTNDEPTDRPIEYVGNDTHQDDHQTADLDTESSASLKIIRHSTTQKSTSSVVTHITDIQTLLGRRLPITTVKKLTMPVLKSLAVHKGILPDMDVKIRKNELVDLFMKHQEE
jgi:hypothetical protein